MSSIRPTYGRVMLTDYSGKYPNASDHNLLHVRLSLDATTTAQAATFNVRRYILDLKTPYDWDVYRDHRAAQIIMDSTASVVAVQECDPQQDTYLLKKLPEITGVTWQGVSIPTNVGIFFKSDRWKLVDWKAMTMENGGDTRRRLVLAYLESVKTGSKFWFGSTHLGVGPALAIWRRSQAKAICEFLKNVPGYGDIRQKVVVMGDFNDYAAYTSTGVRQVMSKYGFRDQRDRLSDADFDGDTLRTNHGFGKLTVKDGRQIDAVFTPL